MSATSLTRSIVLMMVLLTAACSPLKKDIGSPPSNPNLQVAAAPTSALPQAPSATPAPTQAAAMSGMPAVTQTGDTPALKVSDQVVSMGMVSVDEVVSSGPGWVVIYNTKPDGQPDQPIGHAAVKDGESYKVMVQVDQSKAVGTLIAMLHVDRGVVGTFEFPSPDQPVMVAADMISSSFKAVDAQAAENAVTAKGTQPSITVANQPIKDGKIVLPQVISSGEAWVVIHKQNGDGSMGPMVGYAKVQDGINKNVVVPLDTSLTSTVMYAMLHEDRAKKASPDFPGSDVPVMVNGQMISPTFEITTSGAADVIVSLGSKPETQNYLVDGNDMSLYVSLRDSPGKSNCDANCQTLWRPLLATGKIIPGDRVNAKNLGVALLPDGSRQVTYLGAPLYLFTKDEKPGDVNGQGYDGTWYLVTP